MLLSFWGRPAFRNVLASPLQPVGRMKAGWAKAGAMQANEWLCGEELLGAQWDETYREMSATSLAFYYTVPGAVSRDQDAELIAEFANHTVALFVIAINTWFQQFNKIPSLDFSQKTWIAQKSGNPADSPFARKYEAVDFLLGYKHLLTGENLVQQLGASGLSTFLRDLEVQTLGLSVVPNLWPALVALVLRTPQIFEDGREGEFFSLLRYPIGTLLRE